MAGTAATLPDVSGRPIAAIDAGTVEAAIERVLPGISRQPVPVASFGSAI
jgi:hypothetical protein